MLKPLFYLLGNILTILALSSLLDKFEVVGFGPAAFFILILTLLQWTVVPIIKTLAWPLNLLTLGLVNGAIHLLTIGLAAALVSGIDLLGGFFDQLFSTLIIAICLSLSRTLIDHLMGKE